MRNTSLYVRISIGFLALFLLATALVAVLLRHAATQRQIMKEITTLSMRRANALDDLSKGLVKWSAGLRGYTLGGPSSLFAESRQGRREVNKALDELSPLIENQGDRETTVALRALAARMDVPASKAASMAEAKSKGGFSYYQHDFVPLRDEILKMATKAADEEGHRINAISADYSLRGEMMRDEARLGMLIALLAALILAWLTARAVILPVRRISTLADIVAGGDYGSASQLRGLADDGHGGGKTGNEVVRLARAFSTMVGAVERREVELQERNERLDSQNEELQAQNEEIQAQSEELQAQNEEIQVQNEEIHSQQRELEEVNESLTILNKDLAALQSITSMALSSLDLEEMLGRILGSVIHAMSADVGGVFLLEPDGKTVALHQWQGPDIEDVKDLYFPIGEGFAGRVADEGKPPGQGDRARRPGHPHAGFLLARRSARRPIAGSLEEDSGAGFSLRTISGVSGSE